MITNFETEKVTRAQAERWGALYKYEGIPTWRTALEAEKWAREEERRWYEGYNGLDGMYYKYLTQYKIKDGTGLMIRPYWRDGDHFLVAPASNHCISVFKDKFTLKRREYGLSGWDGGFVPLELAARNPGSVINLTSYSRDTLRKLMNQKIDSMQKAMYEDSEKAWKKHFGETTSLWKPKTTYTESKLTLTFDMGSGIRSVIQGVQTSHSEKEAKNMEGDRIVYAFIDEFFLHPYADKVHQSASASRQAGQRNIGSIFLGGSAGQSSDVGSRKAQELWYSHKTLGIEIVFLPSTLCIAEAQDIDDDGNPIDGKFITFMCNGWSIQDEAEQWIHKKRKALYSLSDKTAYWQFVKAYPLSPDEIFEANAKTGWTDEEKARWEKQKKRIIVAANKFRPVHIVQNTNGGYDFRTLQTSPVKVLEEPIAGERYIAGIDPIPFSGQEISEGRSDFGVVIKRLSTNMDVAYYMERNLDYIKVADTVSKMQLAYNKAKAMIERDRGDAFVQRYETLGLSELLVDEPYIWRPANQKKIHKGYTKRGKESDLINHYLVHLRSYDEKTQIGGIENVWDLLLYEQYYNFHIGNKDLADAKQAVELYNWWINEYERRKEMFNNQASQGGIKKVPVKMFINGRMVVKYVEVSNGKAKNILGQGFEML